MLSFVFSGASARAAPEGVAPRRHAEASIVAARGPGSPRVVLGRFAACGLLAYDPSRGSRPETKRRPEALSAAQKR